MDAPTFYPVLYYEDAPAAIEWLQRVFGFTAQVVVPGPQDTVAHAELAFHDGLVRVGSASNEPTAVPGHQSVYVAVPDTDAHHDRNCR